MWQPNPTVRTTIETGVILTVLLSIISLAFSAGIEFNRVSSLEITAKIAAEKHTSLKNQVMGLQTTLPVQMATIQAKLDDISYEIKHRNRSN